MNLSQKQNGEALLMEALLITKCTDQRKWYSHLTGKFVPLLEIEENEFKSREPAGYINFVSKDDAEIVTIDKGNFYE